jgi:hypothetical protein
MHAVAVPIPVRVITLMKGQPGGSGWLAGRGYGNVAAVSLPSWRARSWMS